MSDIVEAKFWLKSAKFLFDSPEDEREKNTVITAQAIHAIIKANDALTVKFLGKRAERHDEAPLLFLKLIEQNKIPPGYANYRTQILIPAINLKSKADYKGIEVSKNTARSWIDLAEKIYKMADETVKK